MKLRIASFAFLIGSLGTALTGLALLPTLVRLARAMANVAASPGVEPEAVEQLRALLPGQGRVFVWMGFALLMLTAITYLLLEWMVGRPLRDVERQLGQLQGLEPQLPGDVASAGPLLSRVQASLRRTADALRSEKALTARQMQELQEANSRLQQAHVGILASERLASVGRLAAGVAHEVGNPLSGILGYLSLARARVDDAEVKDFLSRIDEEVHRIDGIVRNLLDLGRPKDATLRPVAVRPVLEGCIRLLSASPDFKEVELRLMADDALFARAEPGSLSQIVLNLLLNAAQAMGGRGAVMVSAHGQGSDVFIEVVDQGPGLPPAAKARLFEPFFTTKPAGKGTGLGLAVSHHLAHAMEGVLEAEDRPSGGALFRVRLRGVEGAQANTPGD
ncbi:MAG: sensor histidine kinase [Myxococcaceae bacterium]